MTERECRLKALLDEKVLLYNRPAFIEKDPVSVPHLFTEKRDIEIAGFFAAVLAWGNRTAIINSCRRLLDWMDYRPYEFILQHRDTDLKPFLRFAHRTFNATDLLYFFHFLQYHYRHFDSLEDAFMPGIVPTHIGSGREDIHGFPVPAPVLPHAVQSVREAIPADTGTPAPVYNGDTVEQALVSFHDYFFSLGHPGRTRKHIATPARKSACKRLNMYLRWMVRSDGQGVDFGIWRRLSPRQLVCPLDVHVARVAHRLGLLPDDRASWHNALALTRRLRRFNREDPAVYDYALFGLGMAERL